jgi:hypothetical protein
LDRKTINKLAAKPTFEAKPPEGEGISRRQRRNTLTHTHDGQGS